MKDYEPGQGGQRKHMDNMSSKTSVKARKGYMLIVECRETFDKG